MTDELDVDRDTFVAIVFDLEMLSELGERRRFLCGGKGTGGSAGLVFSYRKPTMLVSSRKEGSRLVGERFFRRTEANLVGNMLGMQDVKGKGLAGKCACSGLCCRV